MIPLTAARRDRTTALLAELVRIPSVNTGAEQADRDRAEARMAGFVASFLGGLGMTVSVTEVRPGRPNVVGRWAGPAVPPLTFQAHLDTVGIAEMTVPPFGAEVRDGCLLGRGACDTKGSMAAFLAALAIAHEEGWRFDRPVQFVATMNEEAGCEGAKALVAAGTELGEVVVGEPTGCRAVIAEKGCLWLGIHTTGRAAHASRPETGRSAIFLMGRVLQFIESVWLPALAAEPPHPLLGNSTCSVGLIRGGEKVNVVPPSCAIELDVRLLPGDTADAWIGRFTTALRQHLGDAARDVEVTPLGTYFPAFELAAETPFVGRVREAIRAVGVSDVPEGVSYFSDGGVFQAAGWPVVVFGPGDIGVAHGPEEYLPLAELHQAVEVSLGLLAAARV